MKLTYVLPSPKKKSVPNMLSKYSMGLDFDIHYLCSTSKDKILKKDIDLDLTILDNYDIICPVGAESLKYTCGLTGITKYNGMVVEERFFPIIDPNMLAVKPQMGKQLEKAFTTLTKVVNGVEDLVNEKDYRYVETEDEFVNYILPKLRDAEVIAVDTETTSLSPRKGEIIGMVLSTKVHEGFFVASDIIEDYIDELQEIFDNSKIVFHNAKFDMAFIKREFGITFDDFEDTILMHYVLEEAVGTHGLKDLAIRFTDLGDYDRALNDYKKSFARQNKILLKDFNYGMLPLDILAPYACKDGDATLQVYDKFDSLIYGRDNIIGKWGFPLTKQQNPNSNFINVYENILKPATKALMHIENTGGPISKELLLSLEEEYEIDIEECVAEILMHPAVLEFEREQNKTFNPNSIFHLREVFFNILGLPSLKKTDTGADSTDAEVLGQLDHPLAEAVLDLRKKVKLLKTYIKNIKEGLDIDNRLRSSFNIIGTAAGRLSSSGVLNYQNLPRDKNAGIKNMFKAADGYSIVQVDLGTAEVYVAAVLANDSFFQNAFKEGLDFHSYVAKNMFKLDCPVNQVKDLYPDERQAAKAITFGIMYQAGPAKIASEAGVTFQEAKKFIDLYFRQAKDLKRWIDYNLDFIKHNHYTYSSFGRKRRLSEVGASNQGVAKHAERSGLNFLIQSVASDVNLMGLIDLVNWVVEEKLEKEIKIFATVHDSIVAEVSDVYLDLYCKKVVEFLQKDRGASIPGCPIGVDCEVGPSWGEVKGYDGWKKAA